MANADDRSIGSQPSQREGAAGDRSIVKGEKKKSSGKKTLWVTIFRCFHCGKHGHNLPKCRQCSQAYYCNADCQRKHWRKHRPVCRAAVAALARRAHRERLARAVREKGRGKWRTRRTTPRTRRMLRARRTLRTPRRNMTKQPQAPPHAH